MIDYSLVPSPCFVLDEGKLETNLKVLQQVRQRAGVEIILAFKGFAMWHSFPLVRKYLNSAAASSYNEARLCFEEMGSKAHTYMVAFSDDQFDSITGYSSHLTFNSISQFKKFKSRVPQEVSIGLRVNPEWSDVKTELYDPSSPKSRLGLTKGEIGPILPPEIEGLHFHVLCESSAEALEQVLKNFEERFGHLLHTIRWVNMGGGHLITQEGYNVDLLIGLLKRFQEKYEVKIILEPGAAVAWQAGDLVSTVLDIVENNGIKTAVTNTSFTCHMPDCLEMPYRPEILNAYKNPDAGKFKYRIGGLSCLAGDFMELYGFDKELKVGDRIVFKDMMHYTMVKTTTFNGVDHPSIGIWTKDGKFKLIRRFGYDDFKNRLS